MKAAILDRRDDDGGAVCFLCRITLLDYIQALPSTYRDYDIQREIVSNVYLDHLVDTVLSRRHIPPLVLVADSSALFVDAGSLKVNTFKILDGLQRTFRLQTIWKTVRYCTENLDPTKDYLSWSKFKFSRTFSQDLQAFDSNTDVLRAVVTLFQELGEPGLLSVFAENPQWFEVWTGLTPEEEVRKMLTLNAGHKPVKTRHQLELLFLNLLPILREGEGQQFQLVRERDISSTQFSKGREPGTFHFAHIITSVLSLLAAAPVAPSTGLIQEIQSSDSAFDLQSELADPAFLKAVVTFLVQIDRLLAEQYGDIGTLWMGREVSLAGLCGAIGAVAEDSGQDRKLVMSRFIDAVRSSQQLLNLEQFERVRNSLDLSKVNIGNANRRAVFSAIKETLGNSPPPIIDWRRHFGVDGK